jgi:hypothetical protein
VVGLINCRAMTHGQEGVDLIASRCERKGVRPLLCCDLSDLLHPRRVEDVDHALIANGGIQALVHTIEEHNIGAPLKGL